MKKLEVKKMYLMYDEYGYEGCYDYEKYFIVKLSDDEYWMKMKYFKDDDWIKSFMKDKEKMEINESEINDYCDYWNKMK